MLKPTSQRGRAHALLAALSLLPASMMATKCAPHGPNDPPDEDDPPKPGGNDLRGLIARAGTAEAAANELWRDNFTLRDGRRKDKQAIADLTAKLPKDGEVVLTKEQAADWTAYEKLGKPADIEKGITEGKTAAEAVANRTKADQFAKVAADAGYNPEVFAQLAEMNKLSITTQTIKDGQGKDVTIHNVTPEGGQPIELGAYATANWGPFLPSLTAKADGGGGAGGAGGGGQNNQQQQQWTGAGGAGGGGGGGATGDAAKIAQDLVAARANSGHNPLAPKVATAPATGPGTGTA